MVGKSILHYTIVEKIGQGGMGVVYKAEDTRLKRTVALKFLLPHILSSDEEKSRFVHEAQAAAALHHPNICTIYEINEADDQTFISMAYLEGEGLNERIDRGRLKPVEAVRIALQLARGLKAAHEKNIVHRDIKSSNIMVAVDGRATIMDFGLAKSVKQTHATQRGAQVGTIAYMSPEQTRGDAVDHRTDIWALGVLLYEMVGGRRPFVGDYDEAVIYSILNEEAEPLDALAPDAPEDIWIAVRRAIAKSPDNRYQTTNELVEDLEILYDDLRTGTSTRRRVLHASRIVQPKKPVTKTWFSSRVFSTLAIYLVASWFLVRAIGWVAGRMEFSPRWADVALIGFLSLIPTVWILAARDRAVPRIWRRVVKVGIPANLVATAVLLVALFAGRDLGATTKRVTVLDEEGKPIERMVAKSEYRKSLLVFYLDSRMEDTTKLWVGGGMMLLLQVDLYQDGYVYAMSSIDQQFRRQVRDAGFSSWFDAPWSLKRQTAERAHLDYLVTGSFEFEDSALVVELLLHESQSGRLVMQREFRGESIFEVTDEASVALRRAMGFSEGHIDAIRDLPVSEIFTGSVPAVRHMCLGMFGALSLGDWAAGVEELELSVAEDPTFAWGHFTLNQLYMANNVADKADGSMQLAMRHIYRLPERMQFMLKSAYYDHVGDPEKRLAVVQMMTELYPEDLTARMMLADLRLRRDERALAIEQFEAILEIDPSRTEFMSQIGEQYREMGRFDDARRVYDEYLLRFPNDGAVWHARGLVDEVEGRYEDALAHYEKTLVLDPNNSGVLCDIGDIEGKIGDDIKALEMFDRAMEVANTPQDRARVHESLQRFHMHRGQTDLAIRDLYAWWDERAKYLPPVVAEMEKLGDLGQFVRAGKTQTALDEYELIASRVVPPFDGMLPLGRMAIYFELEEPDSIETAVRSLRIYIADNQAEFLRDDVDWAEGVMEEARGNYESAIRAYERKLEIDPTEAGVYRFIGRCYRKLGRYDEAIESLERVLAVYPKRGPSNYELALVYWELGDRARAHEHLEKALERWKDADPDFEPANEARQRLSE